MRIGTYPLIENSGHSWSICVKDQVGETNPLTNQAVETVVPNRSLKTVFDILAQSLQKMYANLKKRTLEQQASSVDQVKFQLVQSVMLGYADTVSMLLEHNKELKINECDYEGSSLLVLAVENGHKEVVDVLLKQPQININAVAYNGLSVLMIAVVNGYSNIVESLLSHSELDINQRVGCLELTAFTTVIVKNNLGIAKLLLADSRFDLKTKVLNGETTIMQCARFSDCDAIFAACMLKIAKLTHDVKMKCLKSPVNKRSALHLAARYGTAKMVDLLLQQGVSIDGVDEALVTPLMHSVLSDKDSLEKLKKLISCKQQVLDSSASSGSSSFDKIKSTSDFLNVKNKKNDTALIYAVHLNKISVARLLVERGADVWQFHPDYKSASRTLFYLPMNKKYLELCQLLASNMVDDVHSSSGDSRLSFIKAIYGVLKDMKSYLSESLSQDYSVAMHDIQYAFFMTVLRYPVDASEFKFFWETNKKRKRVENEEIESSNSANKKQKNEGKTFVSINDEWRWEDESHRSWVCYDD